MPRKARSDAADFAVYCAIRCGLMILQALPVRIAFGCADWLAWLGYSIDKRHRKVAAENLRFAFPTKKHRQIDQLVFGCYRHFLRLLVEIAMLPRKFRLSNWRSLGGLVGGKAIVEAMFERRATIIVTAHFGNWELAGYALGAFGFRTYAIARVLDNPYLEHFLKQFRQATGQSIIAKKDDFDRLKEVLGECGTVAILADQDAGPRGVFVDFFGRPASAHKAVALLAIEFNAKMLVVGVPRTVQRGGQFFYEITCEDEIDPQDYANDPNAVKAITQRYHAALERAIRRHPEQYFWLHRRWKTAPAAKKSLAKAA